MEAKDLMIGDWVYNKNIDNPMQIYPTIFPQMFRRKPNASTEDYNIFPITLTPEILEKNGFILKPDGWLWCKEKGIDDKNYIFIQFRKGCDEVRLVELNFVNKVLAKYEQIHYVHELQHALRLCGIEKDIQL